MPILSVSIEQVVEIIENMSKGEVETLLIELDSELSTELKQRFKKLPLEIKEKKVLSVEEAFDV